MSSLTFKILLESVDTFEGKRRLTLKEVNSARNIIEECFKVCGTLKKDDYLIQYFEKDFEEYVVLEESTKINELPKLLKVAITPKVNLRVLPKTAEPQLTVESDPEKSSALEENGNVESPNIHSTLGDCRPHAGAQKKISGESVSDAPTPSAPTCDPQEFNKSDTLGDTINVMPLEGKYSTDGDPCRITSVFAPNSKEYSGFKTIKNFGRVPDGVKVSRVNEIREDVQAMTKWRDFKKVVNTEWEIGMSVTPEHVTCAVSAGAGAIGGLIGGLASGGAAIIPTAILTGVIANKVCRLAEKFLPSRLVELKYGKEFGEVHQGFEKCRTFIKKKVEYTHELKLDEDYTIQWNPEMKHFIATLPKEGVNSLNFVRFREFFVRFGTHVKIAAKIGGEFRVKVVETSSEAVHEKSKTKKKSATIFGAISKEKTTTEENTIKIGESEYRYACTRKGILSGEKFSDGIVDSRGKESNQLEEVKEVFVPLHQFLFERKLISKETFFSLRWVFHTVFYEKKRDYDPFDEKMLNCTVFVKAFVVDTPTEWTKAKTRMKEAQLCVLRVYKHGIEVKSWKLDDEKQIQLRISHDMIEDHKIWKGKKSLIRVSKTEFLKVIFKRGKQEGKANLCELFMTWSKENENMLRDEEPFKAKDLALLAGSAAGVLLLGGVGSLAVAAIAGAVVIAKEKKNTIQNFEKLKELIKELRDDELDLPELACFPKPPPLPEAKYPFNNTMHIGCLFDARNQVSKGMVTEILYGNSLVHIMEDENDFRIAEKCTPFKLSGGKLVEFCEIVGQPLDVLKQARYRFCLLPKDLLSRYVDDVNVVARAFLSRPVYECSSLPGCHSLLFQREYAGLRGTYMTVYNVIVENFGVLLDLQVLKSQVNHFSLNHNLLEMIGELPPTCNSWEEKTRYIQLFERWGTHVKVGCVYGGKSTSVFSGVVRDVPVKKKKKKGLFKKKAPEPPKRPDRGITQKDVLEILKLSHKRSHDCVPFLGLGKDQSFESNSDTLGFLEPNQKLQCSVKNVRSGCLKRGEQKEGKRNFSPRIEVREIFADLPEFLYHLGFISKEVHLTMVFMMEKYFKNSWTSAFTERFSKFELQKPVETHKNTIIVVVFEVGDEEKKLGEFNDRVKEKRIFKCKKIFFIFSI